MNCLHKRVSSPVTVSFCLTADEIECCPNEYETMVVCGDCGNYKITSVQEVCADCCDRDVHIWDEYLNKWYPANAISQSEAPITEILNYTPYLNAYAEAQALPVTPTEFMVQGYHYTKPTDPIRTDSARLFVDTSISTEECEVIPLFIDPVWAQSILNYDTQSNSWNNLAIWKDDPTIVFYGNCIINYVVTSYTLIWNFFEDIWYDENMNILNGLEDIKAITYSTWMSTPQISFTDESSISYIINNLNIDTKNFVDNGITGNAISVSYRDPNQFYKMTLPETVGINNSLVHFKGIHNFYFQT